MFVGVPAACGCSLWSAAQAGTPKLMLLLLDIQGVLSHLLGDQFKLTQETAS